jgi:sugar/nucleoside kinase (ribokinase family)
VESIALIGNVNLDVVVRGAGVLPPPGAEWLTDAIDVRAGGAAANAALTLAGLRCRPLLVGCVGEDASGELLRRALLDAGVKASLTTIQGASTGVSVAIEAVDRERSFFTSLGALTSFDVTMIPTEALRSRSVLLCGYFLLPALRGENAKKLLASGRAGGATTLLDCGWDPDDWTMEAREEVRGLLAFTDVFLPNEGEASALTGEREPEAAAHALHSLSGGTVIVKLGPRGCLAIAPNGAQHRIAAPRVETGDTTGAGDAFNAGILYGLARGLEWPEILSFATKVASAVVGNTSRDRYTIPRDLIPSLDDASFPQ